LLATPKDWVWEHPLTKAGQQPLALSEWVLLFWCTTVLAPLGEEIFFRGVLLPWQLRHGWVVQALTGYLALVFAGLQGFRPEGKTFWWTPAPVLFVPALLPGAFLFPRLPWPWRPPPTPAGTLAPALSGRRSLPAQAVYVNGLLFAAMHSAAWPSSLPLCLPGVALAWLRSRTGSLVGGLTLHALFNAVAALSLVLLQLQS